jgi:hypothetical protein
MESVESCRNITASACTLSKELNFVHQRISTDEREPIIEAEILRAKRMRRCYLCVYILGIALMAAGYYAMDWTFIFAYSPKNAACSDTGISASANSSPRRDK